jgi:hypothetical protein
MINAVGSLKFPGNPPETLGIGAPLPAIPRWGSGARD